MATMTDTHLDRNIAKIRAAYAEILAHLPGARTRSVGFASLREEAGLIRADFDAAIRAMVHLDDCYVIAESNQKALRPAAREAAVLIGNQNRHYIRIG